MLRSDPIFFQSSKRKNLWIVFLICVCGYSLSGQKSSYQFPEKFPQYYNFSPDEAFEALNKRPYKGLDKKQATAFRINGIYGTQQSLDQNEVYLDWIEVENYLKKILDTIIPEQYKKKNNFEVFLSRDPNINAYALDNGFLFINIGLLASLRNEAALAATIGHETGHAIYDHGYNRAVDLALYRKNNPNEGYDYGKMNSFFAKNYEIVADTFAFTKMIMSGYNLKAVKGKFDIFDREFNRQIHTALPAYTTGNVKRIRNYFKTFSSHPMNEDRVKIAMYYADKAWNQGKNYIVDSVFFNKLRKVASEECKKIRFEKGEYKECLELSFVDYLYNPNNLKNQYYLIESLRRLMYVDPEIKNKGFLTDKYSDKEFVEYNYSILKKPELLFLDSIQESELIGHKLFSDAAKPFNSYAEALVYFCNNAIKLGFNEANFSLGLYYYAQKDEANFVKSVEAYLKGTGPINEEMAGVLLQNKKLISPGKKMLFIYDNSGMFAEDNFWYGANYRQTKSKMALNKELATILVKDTSKVELVFVNELMGSKPRQLYEYQKIEQNLITLYSDKEKNQYRKKRVSSKESVDDQFLTHKYTKQLFILQPELYKWCKENDYASLCFANISYDYEDALATTEMRNDYTAYYLDFNVLRPYVKKGVRSAVAVKKQSDVEIAKDIMDFLYGKD